MHTNVLLIYITPTIYNMTPYFVFAQICLLMKQMEEKTTLSRQQRVKPNAALA